MNEWRYEEMKKWSNDKMKKWRNEEMKKRSNNKMKKWKDEINEYILF